MGPAVSDKQKNQSIICNSNFIYNLILLGQILCRKDFPNHFQHWKFMEFVDYHLFHENQFEERTEEDEFVPLSHYCFSNG